MLILPLLNKMHLAVDLNLTDVAELDRGREAKAGQGDVEQDPDPDPDPEKKVINM